MRYRSTRGHAPLVSADQALRAGVAPDGGLYLPQTLPQFEPNAFAEDQDLGALAGRLLRPFFADSALADSLPGICASAFDFPLPLVTPDPAEPGLQVLELFHGPTGAFKDFGARFLFRAFDAIANPDNPITVLAATSGDTGGAVGCAAEGARHARAVILFPKGRISAFQERQLCCWRDPVTALRVNDDFDACQRLVKTAFADKALSARHGLSSANSISIGRLLPQMAYWAQASLEIFARTGTRPGLVVPTGNLGNGFAALLARACGLPIGPVVLATNANATLSDWHASGQYTARQSIATLANAMDVGAPSNFERLSGFGADLVEDVVRVDDAAIRQRIVSTHAASGYIACPHTATALEAYARMAPARRAERVWIAAATAHPCKFADAVEPLIGQRLTPPPSLAEVLQRPVRLTDIAARLDELAAQLEPGRAG
ncbi:threonine synthase [Maricaulis salignorans]|uniref:Threonine synthase n=1 Tax=Maricaulis salignorans TaxID=144026 RepID=A0A1G9VMP3_9PROT|nr:threonine synthase [Maricaulis salignorans]SDM73343.1 L-threonine synthase [Maricaulis salignorans]